jgi:hypothetical protein
MHRDEVRDVVDSCGSSMFFASVQLRFGIIVFGDWSLEVQRDSGVTQRSRFSLSGIGTDVSRG